MASPGAGLVLLDIELTPEIEEPVDYPIDPYYESPEWRKLHAAVLERDGYRCRYCGDKGPQADHIVPRKRGGADELENLACCCPWCNSMARNRVFSSFDGKKAWLLKQRERLAEIQSPDPTKKPRKMNSAKREALERGVPVWIIYRERCRARKARRGSQERPSAKRRGG